jgi:hypothetical protein
MNTRLALILTQFLWMPGLLPAQQCRILSLDHAGLVTFQVSETNRYGGFQYASGLGESNVWINASAPLWDFPITNSTMSMTMPSNVMQLPGLFLRLVCSADPLAGPSTGNRFEVYGGASFSTTEPNWWVKAYDPLFYAYTPLGTATTTATFNGSYNFYLIRTSPGNVVNIDAVLGTHPGGGTWYPANIGGNITDWPNVEGPPDGVFAQLGIAYCDNAGFIVLDATGAGLTSITVYVAP